MADKQKIRDEIKRELEIHQLKQRIAAQINAGKTPSEIIRDSLKGK